MMDRVLGDSLEIFHGRGSRRAVELRPFRISIVATVRKTKKAGRLGPPFREEAMTGLGQL